MVTIESLPTETNGLSFLDSRIKTTVHKFIKEYFSDPLIAGALLTGSYATGIKVS
ncbi:MAG: hypothetical protein AAB972_01195 [Patescibacteria group bacterium]